MMSEKCAHNEVSSLHLMDSEDMAFLENSILKEKEALLKSRLLQRTQGLKHMKMIQAKQSEEVEDLKQRIEELCRMLRNRNNIIDKLRFSQSDYEHQVKVLEFRLQNKRHGLQGLPDRKLNLPKGRTEEKAGAKLPTLVQVVREHRQVHQNTLKNFDTFPSINERLCKYPRDCRRLRECEKIKELEAMNERVALQESQKLKQYEKMSQTTDSSSDKSNTHHLEKVKKCLTLDKWVSNAGGQLELPGITVSFSANTIYDSVLVSLMQYPRDLMLQEHLRNTGFHKYLDVNVTFGLQPNSLQLLRPLTVTLKDARPSGQGCFFVFTKSLDRHSDTIWQNSTEKSKPKVKQDYMSFQLHSACLVCIVRVTLPMYRPQNGVTYSQGVGLHKQIVQTDIRVQALSLMNGHCIPAVVTLYSKQGTSKIMMVITKDTPEMLPKSEMADVYILCSDTMLYDICDGETLYTYLNGSPLWKQELVVDIEQIQDSGQYCELTIKDAMELIVPETSTFHLQLKRKVADADTVDLCTFCLPQMRNNSFVGQSGYSASKVLDMYHERIAKTVDVRFLLDELCELSVFTKQEAFHISHEKDRAVRTSIFLKKLRSKGDKAIWNFNTVLSSEYPSLAEEMADFMKPVSDTYVYSSAPCSDIGS